MKIIATIGPRTADELSLMRLYNAGMRIARLNGAHADLQWHAEVISRIKRLLPQVPILFDIPGRKIRTCPLAHEPFFQTGDTLIFTTDSKYEGTKKVPISYNGHFNVPSGTVILADDGRHQFNVLRCESQDIYCRAITSGVLKSRKGIHIPGISYRADMLSQEDKKMLNFSVKQNVTYVGLSFVDSKEYIQTVRDYLNHAGPLLVSKIENQNALNCLEEIISVSDWIMIDRGDLSIETHSSSVIMMQKKIIQAARAKGVPVIVATEMLNSMVDHPFPTKAEISDITNAVLDGASALMLSQETAIGQYPVETIEWMNSIVKATTQFLVTRKFPLPHGGEG